MSSGTHLAELNPSIHVHTATILSADAFFYIYPGGLIGERLVSELTRIPAQPSEVL